MLEQDILKQDFTIETSLRTGNWVVLKTIGNLRTQFDRQSKLKSVEKKILAEKGNMVASSLVNRCYYCLVHHKTDHYFYFHKLCRMMEWE